MPWPLTRPTADAHYLLYCRAYAGASALRLTLPDAMQEHWLAPTLLNWLGVALLTFNGCFAGWVACAIGAALPLVFLEDQLSQSVYLLCCALAALACFAGDRERKLAGGLQAAVRWFTIGVYGFATLHKLNRDYFDPTVSCANEGLRVLAERSPGIFPETVLGSFDHPAWPVVHLLVEATIVLLLTRRPRSGVVLAALMHIPLTIIFAPGFAFTMISGWLCFFTHADLTAFRQRLRLRWRYVLVLGGLPAVASRALFFPGRWGTDPDWCIKEMLLWLVAASLIIGASRLTDRPVSPRFPPHLAGVVVGAFVANGLTPYLGVQFHHTAAMLSNLRIDEGCHNSFVFPETMRGAHDPYVRMESVEFAPHRADQQTRDAILERLWTPRALHDARKAWCRIHSEPLPARGRYQGREFSVANLCTEWPLPEPAMTGFRRFQVNLKRTCPQRCLH